MIAPLVLAVTFTQFPPFLNQWNGILEWPALGHRSVPEVRSAGVSPPNHVKEEGGTGMKLLAEEEGGY